MAAWRAIADGAARGTAPFVRSPRVPQGTVMELLVTTLADEL
jgi:hypothetical protein